jgi:hypothetical protein
VEREEQKDRTKARTRREPGWCACLLEERDKKMKLLVAPRSHLAPEGTEAERVREAPAADLAGVGDALARPGLRPAVEEHDLGAVDHIRLHVRDVDQLPHLRHPDHVVVRRPPDLRISTASSISNITGPDGRRRRRV